jgi:hypothetical protein
MKRIAIKWLVLAGAAGLALAAVGWFGLGLRPAAGGPDPFTLASSPACSASGATFCVSSPTPGPVLYPGATPSSVPVTFSNPISVPIYVTSLTVSLTNSFPAACLPTWFKIGGVALAGSPPSTTISFSTPIMVAGGSSSTYSPTLQLSDSGSNQNACARLALTLSYSATARYTVPTTTSLSISPSPSTDGQTVTMKATVQANVTPAAAGATPTGTINFFKCASATNASTCTTSLGSATLSAGMASTTTSFAPTGSYYVQAVYVPSDSTSFSASSSSITTQTVGGCVAPPTTGAQTILTGTHSGSLEVKAGTSVWLNGGTITGMVTVDAGGQFAATGGTIGGGVQASGPVSLSGTSVKGNVLGSAGLFLAPGTAVTGYVQSTGSGPLCSDGNSATQGSVQIGGNLLVQTLTAGAQSSVCGTVVGGHLQWLSNASPVLLGSCGANTIGGNLQVQNNTASVTIAQNAATKNVQVQANTGGGTLTNNSAGGNCQLSGDNPGIVGTGNTAKGTNTCNTGPGGA